MDNRQTFRPLLRAYFIVSVVLYLFVHFFRYVNKPLPVLVNYYLTDFLCMPIILTFCLAGVRYFKKIPHFKLSILMILGMTTFYALLFELFLPLNNHQYHADLLDVGLYFLGAFFFFIIWQKSTN